MGKFLLGKEKSESGVAEALYIASVRQNIVHVLFTYTKAAKQQIIHAKHWNFESVSAGYPHFNTN